MSHVGVKRFGAGSAKEDAAENKKSRKAVSEKKSETDARIEGGEHARMLDDARNPEQADSNEPDRHDRPKQRTDPRGSLWLQDEQRDQHDDRQWQDIRRKRRQGILEALQCTQDGDRRRD